MVKFKKFLLVIVIVLLSVASSYGIDRETLWARLEFSGSTDQYIETMKIAKQNLGLVEEILFFSDMQKFNGPARFHSLQILKEACEEGLITQEHFFQISVRLYSQINSIVNPKKIEESKRDVKAAIANVGFQPSFPLDQQMAGFSSLSSTLFSAGLIKNQGILTSLQQKISGAQKSLEKKGSNVKQTAINQIQAAINELNAQKGKHVTEDGHKILATYCQNLITKIQNTN